MKAKMLTKAEEYELIRRWKERGDEKAKDKLILAHLPLVIKAAHSFAGYKLPHDDLVQEGVFGLLDALERFDASMGNRFATLCRWYVRAALQDYVLKNFSVVKQATTAKGKMAFFKGKRMPHVSLDIILPSGDPWVETIEDGSPSPEDIVESVIDDERQWKAVRRAISKLPPRTRDIIRRRFLNRKVETLDTIANRYGISRERVRQIEQKALTDIKIALAVRAAV